MSHRTFDFLRRIIVASLGMATLALTACAQPQAAGTHVKPSVFRTGTILRDGDPNPALSVQSGDALDRTKGRIASRVGG